MAVTNSITKRRMVRTTDREAREQGAGRSSDHLSLSKPQSHPTSPRFVTRLFWA